MRIRRFAIGYFLLQGTGASLWWGSLIVVPGWRRHFLAPGAPETTLFAFGPADLVFFIAGSFAVAYALAQRRSWGLPALCIQAGAAGYSGLYALSLPFVSGGGWMGAALMVPALVVPLLLVWLLRDGSSKEA